MFLQANLSKENRQQNRQPFRASTLGRNGGRDG
jgi:hypothetical protein